MIRQQLRRMAGIDREIAVEALPGDQEGVGWRTRVQFAVREDGVAGLHAHRSHQVIDVGECLIAHRAITDLSPYGPAVARGDLCRGPGRTGSGERAVIVSPGRSAGPSREPLAADAVLRRAGPRHHRLTPVRGRGYLSQHAAGRDWRVSAGAFWQVHPAAADVLTGAVLASLEPQPGDVALDLYCGVGLFAGVLAPAVGPGGTVIGVEADDAAVRDARHNLREWPWARVHRGDVAAVLAGAVSRPPGWRWPIRPGPGWPARSSTISARPDTGCAAWPMCPATRPRWPATSGCWPGGAGR